MTPADITLDMQIPNGIPGHQADPEEQTRTLQEAVDDLKGRGLTRLLDNKRQITEYGRKFTYTLDCGGTPNNGQILAAYYYARLHMLNAAYVAGDINERQYAARMGATTRIVCQRPADQL